MKYKGIKGKGEIAIRAMALIVAVIMFYVEYKYSLWLYTPLNILVLMICFFEKDRIIDEKGIAIRYRVFRHVISIKYWLWAEISTMKTDYQSYAPNIALDFAKEKETRRVVMSPGAGWGAIVLARNMNPCLDVEKNTYEDRDIYERKKHRIQKKPDVK